MRRVIMIDRATNLLVLFIVGVIVAVVGDSVVVKWRHSEPWEKAWVLKDPKIPAPHDSKSMLAAYRNAYEAYAFEDARGLLEFAERYYRPSSVVVRFSASELRQLATVPLIGGLFLLVPMAINYVRHGGVRLWNRSASKSRPQRPPVPSEP